jgi:hypothetical protein
MMSVPRPAMLVAIVTMPGRPASAMISASRSWNFALSTLCSIFRFFSSFERCSDDSTEAVPTSTGRCSWRHSSMSATIASYFSAMERYTRSLWSLRTIGRCVGTITTSSP